MLILKYENGRVLILKYEKGRGSTPLNWHRQITELLQYIKYEDGDYDYDYTVADHDYGYNLTDHD